MTYKQENGIGKRENDIGEVELIALLHKGNQKALQILFDKHHAALLYFAMQYLPNYQAAEDIIAESFFLIWQKRNDFKSSAGIRLFLYKSVKHTCLNVLKQSKRRNASHEDIKYLIDPDGAGAPEEIVIDKMIKAELLQKLWKDVEKLPPVRRRIFKLFFKEGLSAFQIAKMLKISTDTVRVQKARAIHKLREFFKKKPVQLF